MTTSVVLLLAWLFLSFPASLLLGRAIAGLQDGDRHDGRATST